MKSESEEDRKGGKRQGHPAVDEHDSNQYEQDSFIAGSEEDEDAYHIPYRGGDWSDDQRRHKKSKKHKKHKKKAKKERKMEQEEEFDEGDLDIIDYDEGKALTRLKKRKEAEPESELSDEERPMDEFGEDQEDFDDGMESGQGEYVRQPQQMEEDSLSEIRQIIEQPRQLFDPSDINTLTPQDRALIESDLPERYLSDIRGLVGAVGGKRMNEVQQMLEREDKSDEAEWIYQRMRAADLIHTFDERECRDRIKRVLQSRHNHHLETMYIYYYRKKLYTDYLNLESLWKVQQFDEEWVPFHGKQSKITNFVEEVLASFQQVPPELLHQLKVCHDMRELRYFQEYEHFMTARYLQASSNPNKPRRLAFVSQMGLSRVANTLESAGIFLSPHDLTQNLKQRNQQFRPRSPSILPKEEFERMVLEIDDHDRTKYPMLAADQRFRTFTRYLSQELFSYPELRKVLREKYYRRLVISTTPTKKGQQEIDLYSPFFPVKRIRDKPVSTLRKEIWTLATHAQQLELIRLELKFEWQLTGADMESRERDSVYMQIVKCYYDISSKAQIWNLFRKKVIISFLNELFIPAFLKQQQEQFARQGERQIISSCCGKLRNQLNKGPGLKEGKPIRILSMVLLESKLGVVFVDEQGKHLFSFHVTVDNDEAVKSFVTGENLATYIKQYKPDQILIAANCKRAQTLRKELRQLQQQVFCAFGQVEVPKLMAKKRITQRSSEQECILQALSMARLKKNPMAETIGLWGRKFTDNGVLSMSLHPYQGMVNQAKLRCSLEKIIIEMVNLVGIDINELIHNEHLHSQLQFVCGLGPVKASALLDKLRDQGEVLSREKVEKMLGGGSVSQNCCPFLKVETNHHRMLFERVERDKKGAPIKQYEYIDMLDLTRIPKEWASLVKRKLADTLKTTTLTEVRSKKQFSRLSDENVIILEVLKNPERIRGVDWNFRENRLFDEELVKIELMSRFRNPREPERVMQNKDIFYSLIRETPQTLRRYSVLQVRVLSIKKNYMNVILPQNGLFGYIKLPSGKETEQWEEQYPKGSTIKAVVIGFPFDERSYRESSSEEQELLKIQLGLDFPHKEHDDRHEGTRQDFFTSSFPSIVKELHPLIDLQKDRFELKKEDRPIIEVKEEKIAPKNMKTDFRRISHPKFRNMSAGPAIQYLKGEPIGDFVIRPSSQGSQYLTISWHFFKGIVVHIKIRVEHKGVNNMSIGYKVEDRDNRTYSSLEEIIEKCIRPMNVLVQDVTSNKKFMNQSVQEVERQVKRDMAADSSHIYYYFAASEEFPQYFILVYMYRDKKPIRELIKVRNSGLYFHEQQFASIRDLVVWYKQHLKQKDYQRYVKHTTPLLQKAK